MFFMSCYWQKTKNKNKFENLNWKIPWLHQGIDENSTCPLENLFFWISSQVSAFLDPSKISESDSVFLIEKQTFQFSSSSLLKGRQCWNFESVFILRLKIVKLVENGSISSNERRRHGDGPVERPHRRPRGGHGRAGLHLVLGLAQDVEARSCR